MPAFVYIQNCSDDKTWVNSVLYTPSAPSAGATLLYATTYP